MLRSSSSPVEIRRGVADRLLQALEFRGVERDRAERLRALRELIHRAQESPVLSSVQGKEQQVDSLDPEDHEEDRHRVVPDRANREFLLRAVLIYNTQRETVVIRSDDLRVLRAFSYLFEIRIPKGKPIAAQNKDGDQHRRRDDVEHQVVPQLAEPDGSVDPAGDRLRALGVPESPVLFFFSGFSH